MRAEFRVRGDMRQRFETRSCIEPTRARIRFAVGLLVLGGLAGCGQSETAAPPPPHTLAAQPSCFNDLGRVDVSVSLVADGLAHTVSVVFGELAPRSTVVESGGSWETAVTGRPDGPLEVALSIDGTPVESTMVTVACAALRTEPSVETSCLAARGRVDVFVPNDMEYTVTSPGLPDRVVEADAGGRATWTGLPNGAVPIEVVGGDDATYSLDATIECGADNSGTDG